MTRKARLKRLYRPGLYLLLARADTKNFRNEIQVEITKPPPSPTPSISARGGGNRWRNQREKTGKNQGGSVETIRLAQLARTRARSFLFDVFSGVN